MGRSGSRLWKYAAAVGVMGLLMMMAAILVANRWENDGDMACPWAFDLDSFRQTYLFLSKKNPLCFKQRGFVTLYAI